MIRSVTWSGSYGATRAAKAQVFVLQVVVCSGSSQTRGTTILFEDAVPAREQSGKPAALAAQIGERTLFPGAGARGTSAALAARSPAILAKEAGSAISPVTRSD
jgi:hypothetical protein